MAGLMGGGLACCAEQLGSVLLRVFPWQGERDVYLMPAWFCLGELGTSVLEHSALPQQALAFSWLPL